MKNKYDKNNPFPAKILKRYLINKEGSTKKTYHITLDLSGSNITHKVGDSIGILPSNPPEQVDELLAALGRSPQEKIFDPRSGMQMTLKCFITTKANLLHLTPSLLKFLGHFTLADDKTKKKRDQFIAHHDLIDLFKIYPSTASTQKIISHFAPLLPRFYSIASSPIVSPNTIDLLIATFTYTYANKQRQGVTSSFLSHMAKPHTTPVLAFLLPTPSFTLPASDKPILMIAPGTGVAPYRAFLQERLKKGASGFNWLIFGERNKNTDFYYESFFTSLKKRGFLRLDLAFSRDQKEKVYVQHKLLENSYDVWELIQSNGTIYICGDARYMAKDVMNILHNIVETRGKRSSSEAKALLRQMRCEKRLLMDIY